jgi:hypothetical protein
MQKRMGQTAKAAEAAPSLLEPHAPTRRDDQSVFAMPLPSLCLLVSGDKGAQVSWGMG